MSSDETTTSNEKLPAAPERMERDAIHKLERIELLKLIAATLNAIYYEDRVKYKDIALHPCDLSIAMKYKDIALHPCDLSIAIDCVRRGTHRCKDFNEIYEYLRISNDIIRQLNYFKDNIEKTIQSILFRNNLKVKDGVIAFKSIASLEETK